MRMQLRTFWRRDRLPLFLYLVAFIVMTYPFVFHMHNSLAIHNTDTFKALWQNWWLREALIRGYDINFADNVFYPQGLNLSLDPRRWTTFPIWTILYTVFGDPLAYNLVAMSGVLFKAYGMYLFCVMLFRQRIPAWVAGAFYAFAAPALSTALRQPNTGTTEWIPWFMLALAYGLTLLQKRCRLHTYMGAMTLAGLCFALNMYVNLKIAILAMLIGGPYIAWAMIAHRLWARRTFWTGMLAFALFATVFSLPLLIKTLGSEQYEAASSWPVTAYPSASSDLLAYLKADLDRPLNYRQIVAALSGDQLELTCPCKGLSHVGVVGIVFAVMGAIHIARFRRRESIWIVLTIVSFLLSLGVLVFVNGKAIDIFWLPYRLVQDNFFFRALWLPYRMVIVFVFPFTILIGFGLYSRLRGMKHSRRNFALLVLAVIMLFYDTSIIPIPLRLSPRPAYLSALNNLPEGAVIDLPMGRHNSKYYMSMQRFHGRPIVEGMLPRTPPDAYDYISANPVLAFLRAKSADDKNVAHLDEDVWRAALADLQKDGFRYLILHREVPVEATRSIWLPDKIREDVTFPPPVYQDENVSIYDISLWEGPYSSFGVGSYTELPDSIDLNISVGDEFKFVSWSLLSSHDVQPCQTVKVLSWWEVTQPDAKLYTLSIILADTDGDGQIAVANERASYWQTDVFNRDESELVIPCATASGKYPLLVVMNESDTQNALEFRYPDGKLIGGYYYLTTLTVHKQ